MTKTMMLLMLTVYAQARLAIIALSYYYGTMRLPVPVVLLTTACALICLVIAWLCYNRKLGGATLRLAFLICAGVAMINMAVVLFAQVGSLTNWELVVTGTFFDPIFFLGSCTIPIRDSAGRKGLTPFSRAATHHQEPTTDKTTEKD